LKDDLEASSTHSVKVA